MGLEVFGGANIKTGKRSRILKIFYKIKWK